MISPSSSFFSSHIHCLLQSLDDSNSEAIFRKFSLFAQCGTDESIVILQSCLAHLDINEKDYTNVQPEPLYGLVFRYLLDRPNFCTVLAESLEGMEINVDFLAKLSKALHLALHEKIGLGLALLDSERHNIRVCGKNYCMGQIEELCASHACVDLVEQIHNILMFLHRSGALAKHVNLLKKMLSLVQLEECNQCILPLLFSNELSEPYFWRNLLAEDYEIDFNSVLEEMKKGISMADIIKELGCGCTTNVEQCKAMLCLFSPLTEVTLARILGAIVCAHTWLEDNQNAHLTGCSALGNDNLPDMPSLNSWNSNVLVDSINQLVPGINWIHVNENLDFEGFYFPSEEAFSFFMSTFKCASQDAFPLHAICGSVWKNAEGQLSFLKYAISAPPEVFTFAHSLRQLKYIDAVLGHKSQLGFGNHAWLCLDLLEVLCHLAECGHANDVRLMLTQPLEQCPEVLLLGMAHINTASNLFQYELFSTVFPKMLSSSSGSGMILYLWHVNPNILLRGFVDAYDTDPDIMKRILDICQELKILSPVLDMVPSSFGIRLAMVASQKELVDLEKWASSKLITYKDSFFEECLQILKDIQSDTPLDISTEDTSILIKVLQAHASLIVSSQLLEEMGKLVETFMPSTSATKSGVNNDPSLSDVEEEANSYLKKMFSGALTVDIMIQMLARFKESDKKRDQSLFKCMIGNLFEEYKFLPVYTEMQLKITAVLFGSLIKHQLVTHLTLGVALRAVLDALKKPPDSKMFVFGTTALEQFVERLVEWPKCCIHIIQISHLRSTRPGLVATAEKALSDSSKSNGHSASADQQHSSVQADSINIQSPNTPSVSATVSSSTGLDPPSRSQRFGYTLNIETLVAAAERRESPLEAPTSDTQDKMFCIINNLSASDFEAKAKDFAEILQEPYYPWFAQYMVIKRASVDPNLHDLHLKFLDKVSLRSLDKEVEQATYENCRVLLRSDLIKSSAEERSLLKNLGSWLGKITIGRNTALKACEIDLKSLIIEAYEKDLTIAVIPFTSKILESCQGSITYRPPNPYTMGIIALLNEIYTMPNMKMSLKFEIEVLFKKLGVNMKDVTPTSLLSDGIRKVARNLDFSNKDASSSTQNLPGDAKSGPISTLNQVDLPFEVASSSHPDFSNILSQLSIAMSGIDQKVVINPKLHSLGLFLPFQSVVPAAMGIALMYILPGILYRSVGIAAQTTKELVLKDCALEEDETRIHNAAQLMVASLAGSLAHMTCKEPLRAAISWQLRGLLQGLNTTIEILEGAVQLVTNDNLDLACTIVEQCVTETAIQKIDADIAQHLYMRRNQREGVGSAYFHSNLSTQDHFSSLPEALRPKQGGLSPSQQLIYEDFIRIPWKNRSGDASDALATDTSHQPSDLVSEDIQTSPTQNNSDLSTHVEAGDGISIDLENDVSCSTPSPKSHSVKTSTSGKGLGVASQSLPSTVANELATSEPLLTTGDAFNFSEKVSGLFEEWLRICKLPGVNDEACAHYVLHLRQSGMLNWDDTTDRFFFFIADIVVSHCLDAEMDKPEPLQSSQQANLISFHGIDIYAKLVLAILKFFPVDKGSNNVFLVTKVLAITVRLVQRDEREKKSSFNARPYLRLFINWLHDLGSMEPVNDDANFQVLSVFANAFHSLQPLEVPGFSFAWLELVSHKIFMPKLLTGYSQKGWPCMQRLLVDLFQFLEPSLRNVELEGSVHILYKGTLRMLLVLLHDFPEFLCDYHFSFCDVIPPSCIQMRNMILAASPLNVRIPDPSTPYLKIYLLPEITKAPRILSEVDSALKANQLKGDLDEYLKTRHQGFSFLTDLTQKLLLPQTVTDRIGMRYNVPLINSLVFYVGMQALQQLQANPFNPHSEGAAWSIFQTLVMDLDTEGRYLFLNAVANQLRYPNNHTNYFSFVLLSLFAESNQEIIQEQIARVLLERLIVNRPHPWGLLITFIELVKNPRYDFWSKSFTKCAPEIEKLLKTVLGHLGVQNLSMSA